MDNYLKKKKHFEKRLDVLRQKRTAFEPEWKEVSSYLAPETGRFDDPSSASTRNKDPFYKQNVNTLPSYYINNLSTAMVTNLAPSRLKWFRLQVEDETREESIWLTSAMDKLYRLFSASGLYENLYGCFKEAILYGTNILGIQRSNKTSFVFAPMTIGEYWVEDGAEGYINTCYRTFGMTNIQLAEKFGYDKLPVSVQLELDGDRTETVHTVVHAVEKNPYYLSSFKNYSNKPFISAYYLLDVRSEDFLEYKTTSYFPFMTARWDRTSGSSYGYGIGRTILGDIKSLQAFERDLARASKKKIDPPLKGPTSLKNAMKDASANGITYTDDPTGFSALYNVNYETREALENISRINQRIYQLTFNDLFYALLNKDKTMSATEAAGIQQEKMTMLGSVVERLQTEFLKNLVETSFIIAYKDGQFGIAPESLIGKDMRVEYTSLLAMSQEINDLSMLERYLRFNSSVASINPMAAQKPDVLAMCDFYAKRLGVDQSLVLPNSEVKERYEQAALAQQSAQDKKLQNETMVAQAKAARDLSSANTNSGGALEEMLGGAGN